MSMKKIIFVTNIPTYHKIPLYNELADLLRKSGTVFKVFFLISGEKRRKWHIDLSDAKFEYVMVNEPKINLTYEWTFIFPIKLMYYLFREYPNFIITTGYSMASIVVMIFSMIFGSRYSVYSGEIFSRDTAKSWFRKCIRKIIVQFVDSVIAYGTKAQNYVRALSTQKEPYIAYNTSDMRFYTQQSSILRRTRTNISHEFGLSAANINLIFIGRLVKRKAVDLLIESVVKLNSRKKDFLLHIIGDGTEKSYLQSLVAKLLLKGNVIFWGHKNKDELAKHLAIGDIFVFPSLYDIWGLVLNEAMAAGLPVIASKYAGATYDLVQDGVNGFVVDPHNTDEMAEKIRVLLDNPGLRKKMGENAKQTILDRFTVEKTAEGFLEAIEHGLRSE